VLPARLVAEASVERTGLIAIRTGQAVSVAAGILNGYSTTAQNQAERETLIPTDGAGSAWSYQEVANRYHQSYTKKQSRNVSGVRMLGQWQGHIFDYHIH
jgi:hypothetical protein